MRFKGVWSTGKMRMIKEVLLVEDDHAIAEMLMDAFEQEGLELKWVGTASEAINILALCSQEPESAERPDLVLLDLVLPDSYSREMLMRISQLPDLPPIIIMSAKPGPYLEEAARQVGAAAMLSKPFALDSLWEHIQYVTTGKP
jgi:DNA-binding response OmpR family regulator